MIDHCSTDKVTGPDPRVSDPAEGSEEKVEQSDPRGTWSQLSRVWCRMEEQCQLWSSPANTDPATTCSSTLLLASEQRRKPEEVNKGRLSSNQVDVTLSKLELVQAGENPRLTLLTLFLSNPDLRILSTLLLSSVPWNTI